jgi:hypothetical protein
VAGLTVSLHQGARVSGRVVFAGTTSAPTDVLRQLTLALEPADGRPQAVSPQRSFALDDHGDFTSVEFPPGRYRLDAGHLRGWTLVSAVTDGRDISVEPIEITESLGGVVVTFTLQPSSIGGFVRTATGQGDPSAYVMVFPVDRRSWATDGASPRTLVTVRADMHGQYVVQGLPQGDFYLVAVDAESLMVNRDQAFFDKASRFAERIAVSEGERRTVNLHTETIR